MPITAAKSRSRNVMMTGRLMKVRRAEKMNAMSSSPAMATLVSTTDVSLLSVRPCRP